MSTFDELLSHAEEERRAEPSRADYWQGYIDGLRIGHYGHERTTDEEHEASQQYVAGRAAGYHAGLMAETGTVN